MKISFLLYDWCFCVSDVTSISYFLRAKCSFEFSLLPWSNFLWLIVWNWHKLQILMYFNIQDSGMGPIFFVLKSNVMLISVQEDILMINTTIKKEFVQGIYICAYFRCVYCIMKKQNCEQFFQKFSRNQRRSREAS